MSADIVPRNGSGIEGKTKLNPHNPQHCPFAERREILHGFASGKRGSSSPKSGVVDRAGSSGDKKNAILNATAAILD